MEYITVTRDTGGVPLSFESLGRTWHVVDSLRWFERVRWWETERRMPKGLGRTDVEIWQVQARLGHNPKSALVTFELVCGPDRVRWRIRDKNAIAA